MDARDRAALPPSPVGAAPDLAAAADLAAREWAEALGGRVACRIDGVADADVVKRREGAAIALREAARRASRGVGEREAIRQTREVWAGRHVLPGRGGAAYTSGGIEALDALLRPGA